MRTAIIHELSSGLSAHIGLGAAKWRIQTSQGWLLGLEVGRRTVVKAGRIQTHGRNLPRGQPRDRIGIERRQIQGCELLANGARHVKLS